MVRGLVVHFLLRFPSRPSRSLKVRDDDPKPSSYPYGTALTNEFQWVNWDPKNDDDKKDGQKIHQAFQELGDLVKAGSTEAGKTDGDPFKRWFGKQDDNSEIKKVFDNIWSGDSATSTVAKMVLDRKDFQKDGDKGWCEVKTTMAAYTMADSGRFHVCPYGLGRKQNSEIQCGDLADSCSADMRSLAMTLLHEMTHYNSIGAAARGGLAIIDVDKGSGAYDCFKLDDDDKGDNAQNYAWLAGSTKFDLAVLLIIDKEAYFAGKCDKTFKDPAQGVKSDSEDDTPPSSSSPSPSPTSTSTPLPSPSCAGTPQAPQISFKQSEAQDAIKSFCGNKNYIGQAIVPAVSFGTGLTSDGRHKALGADDKFPVNGGGDNLWLGVSFSEDACIGVFSFDQGECTAAMTSVLTGCNKDTNDAGKYGGQLQNVCAVYRMTARKGSDPDPLTLKSSSDTGDFVCSKTDTSAIGGDSSPLANTCTCHYSNVPGPYDTFKMPSSGDCKDTDKAALLNN
ncbi:MAG: hypothetical protein Q9227_007152 [Pyrenula ochraceoflavens]